MAEQLICNQQVDGSTPFTSSILGDFPSGQRGQTVNLLSLTSVVRIHHPPPIRSTCFQVDLIYRIIRKFLHLLIKFSKKQKSVTIFQPKDNARLKNKRKLGVASPSMQNIEGEFFSSSLNIALDIFPLI